MKKYLFTILFLCFFSAILPAAGDGIWAPMDDYIMFEDDTCKAATRPFYMAAGKQGSVTMFRTPLDQTKIKTFPNGTEFRISYICGKGKNLWASVQGTRMAGEKMFTEGSNGLAGYIPFSDLVQSYDAEEFAKDHANQIRPFDEKNYDFYSGGDFVLWSTPNSGIQIQYIPSDTVALLCDFMEESDGQYKRYQFGGIYTDEKGNRWVEFTYNFRDHGWFDLDRKTEGGIRKFQW